MKKLFMILTSLFSLFAASCNLLNDGFNASIQDFFDENLGESEITRYVLPDQKYETGVDGYINIPSDKDFSIRLFLKNPQGYTFTFGENLNVSWQDESFESWWGDESPMDKAVNGQESSSQESSAHDLFEVIHDKANSALDLRFSQNFLLRCEERHPGVNISPIIQLSHPLSDAQFKQYSALKLKANSPPPSVSGMVIYKYPNDDKECYLIAFNMPQAAVLSKMHRDISTIKIKIDGADGNSVLEKDFEVSIDDAGSFTFSDDDASFLSEDKTKDYTPVNVSKEFHSSNPVMFFSGIAISSYPEIDCCITLSDDNGLSSEAFETTKIQTLGSVTVQDKGNKEIENGAKLQQDEGDKITDATIYLLPPDKSYDKNGKEYQISAQSDIKIEYAVYKGGDEKGERLFEGEGKGKQELHIPVGDIFVKAHAMLDGYVNSIPIEYALKVGKTKLVVNESTGNDGNVGSKKHPFKTISAALHAFDDISNEKNIVILDSSVSAELDYNNHKAQFTILGQPQHSIKDSIVVTAHSMALRDITIGKGIAFSGKKLTLGYVYGADAVKVSMKEKEAALNLRGTIGISEVEFGAEGQYIALERFELQKKDKPIKISFTKAQYRTGDAILISVDGTSLTDADIKNFTVPGNYTIKLQNGKGVLVEKGGSNIEITLPDGEYTFTVSGVDNNNTVKVGGKISFSVKDTMEKPVGGNFEIWLLQNGNEVQRESSNSLTIGNVPPGDYEVRMSVEIDGILHDKICSIAVVSN